MPFGFHIPFSSSACYLMALIKKTKKTFAQWRHEHVACLTTFPDTSLVRLYLTCRHIARHMTRVKCANGLLLLCIDRLVSCIQVYLRLFHKKGKKQPMINGLTDWLRGATVARLTPDQKVVCSNHVGVNLFFLSLFVSGGFEIHCEDQLPTCVLFMWTWAITVFRSRFRSLPSLGRRNSQQSCKFQPSQGDSGAVSMLSLRRRFP